MKIDLTELGLAYRRVKADLYYTRHANSVKIIRFEKCLVENLERLHGYLANDTFAPLYEYCYGWRLVPKDIEFEDDDCDGKVHSTVRLSDDAHIVKKCGLRVIEDLPIEFHIVMQLWIDRVAGQFESQMSDNSHGYRLRRHGDEINRKHPGSFQYWMRKYQDWHDGGLAKIEESLNAGKNVVTLTTDFSAFFHSLKPGFLLNPAFQDRFGVRLRRKDDEGLTKLVVEMLERWAATTPIQQGLPVGCSISPVIANLAVTLLDRQLEALPGLVYYGRYVDDIILAVENAENVQSFDAMIAYLKKHIAEIAEDADGIIYRPDSIDLSGDAQVRFNKNKTKVFVFDATDGLGFIDGLRHQIKRRSSEWRALPDLPDDALELVRSIVAITDKHGVEIDKLRQAEEVSIRRAAFAMKLADFDDYATCLEPTDWEDQRVAFLSTVEKYFTNVKSYFELAKYFPRLVAVAARGLHGEGTDTHEILRKIFLRIAKAVGKAFEGTVCIASREIGKNEHDSYRERLTFQICRGLCEGVASATENEDARKSLYKCIHECFPVCAGAADDLPAYEEFLLADLAVEPYKTLLFSIHDLAGLRCKGTAHPISNVQKVLPDAYGINARQVLECYGEWNKVLFVNEAYSGLLFPVRKLSPIELYAIMPDPFGERGSRRIIEEYLNLQSYAISADQMLGVVRKSGQRVCVDVPDKSEDDESAQGERKTLRNRKIALAYWHSTNEDWAYQVNGKSNPRRRNRYRKLMRLANQVLRSGNRVDYMLFPELAMPWRWFLLMSRRLLQRSQISLISGVEYLRSQRKNMLRNEAWCALRYSGFSFPSSVLVRVVKTAPAEDEKIGLAAFHFQLDSLTTTTGVRAGDVIVHGNGAQGVFFSVLICSDLTNIDLRRQLRGNVDIVHVLAWNQDVKTFNALVTAAAYDLHSYIALCNNGEYGDTRIRAPYMEDYARDVVQVKGGDNEYFVVGKILANAIRRFQKGCSAPNDPKYKPVPIGFKMSARRDAVTVQVPYRLPPTRYVIPVLNVVPNQLVVNGEGPSGVPVNIGITISFVALKTKEKVLSELSNLLKHPSVTKAVIEEFLLCCRECVGVTC